MRIVKSCLRKELENGLVPLVVMLVFAVASVAAVGGGYVLNYAKQKGAFTSNVPNLVEDVEVRAGILTKQKLKNSLFDNKIVGTVILPSGSFSAYKVIDAEVSGDGNEFVNRAKIAFLSGDQAFDFFAGGAISPFYLKDGTKTSAQVMDRVIANLILENNTSYAIKILNGKVEEGKLIGDFVGQTYDNGYIIAGTVDTSGRISNIVIKNGARKTTEVESTVARNAISLFQSISDNTPNTKVLGISDYQPTGFNKPIFDQDTGTWVFAGDIAGGAIISSPMQNIINYVQNVAQSISGGTRVVYQSTTLGESGISNIKSNNAKLAVSIAEKIATLSLDLSGITATGVDDGSIYSSDLAVSNTPKGGYCLSYNNETGGFTWRSCSSQMLGAVIYEAGDGLTSDSSSGNTVFSVLADTGGGLEASPSGVSLLRTCSDGEVLQWTESSSSWDCATVSGGPGGGIATLQVDDSTVVSSATTIDFLGTDFDLTNSPSGEGNLSIDYTNSKITRSDQSQSITASWIFSTAPAISTISNTGTITLPTSTDTLVGRNTTDDLTNKTISAASNTISGLSVSNFSSANISQWTNNSNYLTANQSISLSGDLSGSGTTSINATIANGAVTLAKMANLAANSIIGNNTGSAATPVALTASQVKTLLGISTSDVSGLGTIATQSAGNVSISGGNISGVVSINGATISGGSLSSSAVNGVTTANILLSTGSYSNPGWLSGLTASHLTAGDFSSKINSGTYSINVSGSAGSAGTATTASTANALANTDSAGQSAITAINSASTGTINSARIGTLPYISTSLTSAYIIVGNGSNVATGVAMSGDITIDNTGATSIGNSKVTLGKIANIANNTILGNNSGSAGAPSALSASQAKTLLGISTSDVSGLGTIATQSASNVFITGGNISGVYRINGADISGGSLSATAVNGVTTANILLSTGSYSNPGWLSGLTASHLTAGDFSSKINSGTYSINVSGSAGSATTATTANALANTDSAGQSAITAINSASTGTINAARIASLPYLSTSLTSANIIVGNGSNVATGVSMSGDVTIDNTGLTTIGSGKISLSKMANLAANSIIGNNTGSPATPIALSASDVKTLLAIANTDVSGLGTIATQSAGNVFVTGGQIIGGTINGVTIGGTTRAGGNFTTLDSNGNTVLGDANSDTLTIKAGSSGTGITFFDSSFANCSALETSGGVLTCGSDDTGAGGGISTIQIGDSDVVTTATTIDFLAADFDITNSPTGEGNVSIDYTNSKITRSDQTQSISGAWTFSDLTISDTNVPLTGASLTLDFNNSSDRTLTITNSNSGTANLSVEGTINGSTITGGSLSGTAVNGVTTANILLSTGSYSNPGWLSGLTASHLTAGDFSSKINSGTYSINVSGSAGSATTATTANALANSDSAGQSAITAINSASTGTINSARIGTLPYISTSLTSAYIIVGNGSNVATGVAMSGDVTIDNTGLTTIGSGKVSLSKMANLAANSIIGNNTGSPATPIALSASDVKTLLAIANTDVSGLGTIATQSAGNVFITGGQIIGGTINNVVIGGTTAAAGTFTTLTSSGNTTLGDANSDTLTIKAGSSGTGITFFDSSFANCSALETAGGVLTCGSDDTGAGGGISTIQIGDSDVVTSATTIDFLAADFDITNSPTGEGNVSIDYTNSKITRTDQTQSISGAWTFADLTISDTNVPLTGASLTLDFNNSSDRTLTITNSNSGTANLSVEGTVNGATVTGGSLSGTAVNGVTTANILLSTGSYSNPSWLSGLTASHLTAGDFSSAINSGTYSINVSGSAGSATTATTANALANTDSAGQSAITAINSASTGTINAARIASLPYLSTSLTSAYIIVGNGSNVATGVAMSGDITIDNTGATSIGNSKVTLGKIANIANSTILGNNSGSSGAPIALTASQVKTLLGISTSDVSGLGTIATQSASNVFITGGNISGLYRINGADISGGTISGGSLSTTAVNGVTTANILLSTGSYSNPSWLSGLTASHLTAGDFSSAINSGTYSINVSGSAGSATTATTANALANTDSAGQSAITAINSASTGTINSARIGTLPYISTSLTSAYIIVGNGSNVATGVAMSGDVTIDNTGLTTIGSGKISLSKMANLAANSIIGNNTGSPATPMALSASDVKTLLAIATADVSGLGTIATQSAGNVFITGGQIIGGTINNVVIGGTTAAAGTFTTLTSSGNTILGDANSDTLTIKAGSSGTGITFFDSSFANCSALETSGGVLTCGSDDTGVGGGVSTIKEGGTNKVTSAVALNFAANDFVITDETGGVAGIALDYTNLSGTASGLTAGLVTGLSVTSGKTLTVQKSMTFTAADDTGSYTLPTGTKTLVATDVTSLSSLTTVGSLISGTVIGSQTFTTNNIADSGALTIKSNTTNALTLDSGTTGIVNLGTGTAGKTINIGTDDTTKDTINIGSPKDDFAILSDQWSVTNAGVAAFASITEGGTALSGIYAPIGADYITVAANGTLTGETAIGALSAAISTTSTLNVDSSSTLNTITMDAGANFQMSDGVGTFSQAFSPLGTTATPKGMTITPKFTLDATDQTLSALFINPNTNSNNDSGDILYGINLENISDSTAVESAIRIGSGWNNAFDINGTLITLTEFTILDSGIALSELTDSGTLSISSGSLDVNNAATIASLTLDANTGTALTISGTSFTTDIQFQNGETLDNDTDSQFNFKSNANSTVTILGSDTSDANTPMTISSAGTGALTLDPTGAGSIVLGSIDVTGITFTTDNNAATDFNFTGGVTTSGALAMGGALSGVTTISSSGDWTWTATTPSITINNDETFTITDASTPDTFTVNTSGSLFSFSDGTNSYTFDVDGNTGPVFAGTARPIRKVTLSPEFSGAVLTGDGGSNIGTMTTDFCAASSGVGSLPTNINTSVCNTAGDTHNYYQWTTTQGTAQDYDIWIKWRVPDNFSAWAASNPVKVYAKTNDATNGDVKLYIYDTANTVETNANNADITTSANSWVQTSISSLGGTYTAGSYMTIRVVMNAAATSGVTQVGEISLDYLSTN